LAQYTTTLDQDVTSRAEKLHTLLGVPSIMGNFGLWKAHVLDYGEVLPVSLGTNMNTHFSTFLTPAALALSTVDS